MHASFFFFFKLDVCSSSRVKRHFTKQKAELREMNGTMTIRCIRLVQKQAVKRIKKHPSFPNYVGCRKTGEVRASVQRQRKHIGSQPESPLLESDVMYRCTVAWGQGRQAKRSDNGNAGSLKKRCCGCAPYLER